MTNGEIEQLTSRITSNQLSEVDQQLLIDSLKFSRWLQNQLEHAKISLGNLRRLFGILP